MVLKPSVSKRAIALVPKRIASLRQERATWYRWIGRRVWLDFPVRRHPTVSWGHEIAFVERAAIIEANLSTGLVEHSIARIQRLRGNFERGVACGSRQSARVYFMPYVAERVRSGEFNELIKGAFAELLTL